MRFLWIGIAVLLSSSLGRAQTCSSDIEVTTQAEADAFDCETVSGSLSIAGSGITDLTGLSELTTVAGDLRITDIDSPTRLAGLEGLASVAGNLLVMFNTGMMLLPEMASLESVGGALIVSNNESLSTLDGLSSLAVVENNVSIDSNGALERVADLNALSSVGSEFRVQGNAALATIEPMQQLRSIGGNLFIQYNPLLVNLDAFASLETVGRSLVVESNASLYDVDGLGAVRAVAVTLSVSANASLGACACGLYGLLTNGDIGFTTYIADNAPGCNATSEIAEPAPGTCDQIVGAEDSPETALALTVGPNPAAGAVAVRFELAAPGPARVAVYDVRGRRVATLLDGDAAGETSATLNVSDWAPGVYVVRLDAPDRAETVSFTVAR